MTFIDPIHRRGFLQRAFSIGLLHGAVGAGLLLDGPAAFAQTAGRVVFGFVLTPSADSLITTIMGDLRSNYCPDLGAKPTFLPGNSGALAMLAAANAPPDGATVLLTSSGAMTLLPLLNPLPVDPATALVPVAAVGEFSYAFVVGPAVPSEVTTMTEYLRWAQANPGLATYGLPGRGTAPHFVGSEIARLSNVNLKAVGYKGLLPVLQDVAKGTIPAAVTVLPGGSDASYFPTVRTLAVSASRRWPNHPETPTLMELGLADSPTVDSLGFFVAMGTPNEKIVELREAVRLVLRSPATLTSMQVTGLEPMPLDVSYPDQISRERAEWRKRIDSRHFEADR